MNNLQFNKVSKLANITNNFTKETFTMKTILRVFITLLMISFVICCGCQYSNSSDLADARTCHERGMAYSKQGDYSKALDWYQKALNIQEKVLGKEHPDTATTYNNIALVYSKQGDYSKALDWYQKALNIREKVLGKEHPDTATTYNNIAGVYYEQGDYVKAKEFYLKAKKIFVNKLGPNHPSTKKTITHLKSIHEKTNETEPFEQWSNDN